MESLRRQYDNPINTAQKLFDWADKTLKNIKVIYIKEDQIQATKLRLKERFNLAERVVKTRGFHSFVPKDLKNMYVSRTSSGQKYTDSRRISCKM